MHCESFGRLCHNETIGSNLCVLAANERDKGKKGTFALASERRAA